MGWLLRPVFILGIFAFAVADGGKAFHGEKSSAASSQAEKCLLEECSNEYRQAKEVAGLAEEPSREFCTILHTYNDCLTKTAKNCRGDLSFHSNLLAIRALDKQYCRNLGSGGSGGPHNASYSTKPPPPRPAPPLPSCRYFGSHRFRQCSLFGDPHLKTFDGQYQTCRIGGTWSLLNNAYVSVEVTSEPVEGSSVATAPTKIRITVKGRSTPCTLEKVYVADGRDSLSPYFVDGSDKSGMDRTVTLTVRTDPDDENRQTADIYIRYLAAQLRVRRTGKYLAFSARLPEEVIMQPHYSDDEESVILCSDGCPAGEQLDIVSARGHLVQPDEALRFCQNTEYLSNDIANNLTDDYLDWCIFDVMTAGKNEAFSEAAHAAQSDALQYEPATLRNRSTPIGAETRSGDGGAGGGSQWRNGDGSSSAGSFFLGAGVAAGAGLQLPFYVSCLTLINACRLFLLS